MRRRHLFLAGLAAAAFAGRRLRSPAPQPDLEPDPKPSSPAPVVAELAPVEEPPQEGAAKRPFLEFSVSDPFRILLAGVVGALVILLAQFAAHHGPAAADRQAANAQRPAVDVAAIYRDVSPSVVEIDASDRPQGQSPPDGDFHGTGFVVEVKGKPYIVTNFHVVQGAQRVFIIDANGLRHPAAVRGSDPSSDLAVLTVDSSLGPPLRFDPSHTLAVGDPVVAIGNPLGLVRSASSGIVSGLGHSLRSPNNFTISDVLEIDAPIDHGSSGGPLLDARGRVVGITAAIAAERAQFGFAIPSDLIQHSLTGMVSGAKPRYAWLGANLEDVTPGLAAALHLPAVGVMVASVDRGGPAAKAGLRAATRQLKIGGQRVASGGDLIVSIDDQPISGFDALVAAIGLHQPGQAIRLTLYRGAKRLTVSVTLGDRPPNAK